MVPMTSELLSLRGRRVEFRDARQRIRVNPRQSAAIRVA